MSELVAWCVAIGQQSRMLRAPSPETRLGPRETVAMLAGLMALNAFAIDAMIPALPDIGNDLGVADENSRQLVIVAYFVGFGSTLLMWGPLADRFGRKKILALGVVCYTIFALLAAIAASFTLLIAARAAMGASASVTRVLVTAMVRDLFEGEEMARVMSLVFMVFMVVPVAAPTIGQLILLVGPWRAIFGILALYGLIMGIWSWIRLPETLHSEYRRGLSLGVFMEAARITLTNRLSLGYTLAMTAVFGGLTAYIVSIQQITFDTFGAPHLIGAVFAAVAAPIAFASWLNSRIVRRFGVRRVSHAALIAFATINLLHLGLALLFPEPLWLFIVLTAAAMACFAFTSANISTLAMTDMAPIAGTASSVQGLINTIGGAMIGFVIGRNFDGTQIPFLIGMAASAVAALGIALLTERGRLFGRRDELPASP